MEVVQLHALCRANGGVVFLRPGMLGVILMHIKLPGINVHDVMTERWL